MDVELPWFSFESIDFLKKREWENVRILELGGGGSTLFFGKRGAKLTCLESSKEWAEKFKNNIDMLGLSNVNLVIRHYTANLSEDEFKQTDYYKAIFDEKYDLIIVDNYEESIQYRPACFYAAEKSINAGGMIILDDSWRYENVRKSNSAKSHKIFKSPGPCRLGVTSTDIFFY
ncbi:MAG: class I SAM-dependent methyltransferase [Dysgonamonadaceae bacterium]|nr:class I SAM-dependent methyltransferase [Dysgonamonadaceae bacterium]